MQSSCYCSFLSLCPRPLTNCPLFQAVDPVQWRDSVVFRNSSFELCNESMKLIGDETREEVGSDPSPRSVCKRRREGSGSRKHGTQTSARGSSKEPEETDQTWRIWRPELGIRGAIEHGRTRMQQREEYRKGEARAREWTDRRQYGQYLGPCFLNCLFVKGAPPNRLLYNSRCAG